MPMQVEQQTALQTVRDLPGSKEQACLLNEMQEEDYLL